MSVRPDKRHAVEIFQLETYLNTFHLQHINCQHMNCLKDTSHSTIKKIFYHLGHLGTCDERSNLGVETNVSTIECFLYLFASLSITTFQCREHFLVHLPLLSLSLISFFDLDLEQFNLLIL